MDTVDLGGALATASTSPCAFTYFFTQQTVTEISYPLIYYTNRKEEAIENTGAFICLGVV
jgi:hypothetical protein